MGNGPQKHGNPNCRASVLSRSELGGMHSQLAAADAHLIEESEQACCYAKSNKYWVTDPTGIPWETFHTLGGIPFYGEDTPVFNHGSSKVPTRGEGPAVQPGCCVPKAKSEPKAEQSGCCP